MSRVKKHIILSVSIILALIVLDQWMKSVATHWLKGVPAKVYMSGLVVFEYAENRGAFLSLGASLNESQRVWIFVIGVFFVLAFCFYTLYTSIENLYSVIALSLVITGGIGNLIDRSLWGYVVDYVHMGIGGLRTGVFNVADVGISTGVVMLMLQQLFASEEKK